MLAMLSRLRRQVCLSLSSMMLVGAPTLAGTVRADDKPPADKATDKAGEKKDGPSTTSSEAAASGASAATSSPRSKHPSYSDVLRDFKAIDGLIKLHRKENQLYAEISPSQLNRDFIVLISISRGIGEGMLLGGMTWGFGDDWLWQFRKVDDSIHVVRRNVRFRAAHGSPEEKAVRLAYTDSVLFSLPIVTTGPSGGMVVDLGPIFMSDLPQISRMLPGFYFAGNKSSWESVKGFAQNVELEVAATYASSGNLEFDTVPDSRGATINIHYSISALPQTGYQPRLADDRVGYFLTAIKDFSKKSDEDRFVRYVNRWDLQKDDPTAEVSTPKKPITFYMEKTVPYKYRKPISDGILEWNKAFEKAGFYNAIQVIQQQDSDDWDPEDIRYNTFRWITASAGFAMGPSRVNPITGQILDADIIFDADFVQFWKREYETFTPATIAALTGGPLDLESYRAEVQRLPFAHRHSYLCRCELHHGMSREFALGAISLLANAPAVGTLQQQEKMISQGLKEVVMHEVGHTLGLRHNFKSSSMLSLADLNDTDKTKETGLTGSVMDYAPVNIVPKEMKQGDYYSQTIGPYDMWAIEYGYKPLPGGTEGEAAELRKIAARAAEPQLAYATDEDTRGIDPDPLANRFDMGSDTIEYAKLRAKLIGELWPTVVERVTPEGDGYQRARQAFGVLLGNYGTAMFFASRQVGGILVNRDHKSDPNARPPFVIVPVAKQRDALALVEENVLSDKPFNFPPELYNKLAATRWYHWGSDMPNRIDYAVHEVIGMWQDRILSQLMSSLTLDRIHDSELKVPTDQDALTTAELLSRLTAAVFAETGQLKPGEYSNRKPAISPLRRDLQRRYLKRLSSVAMGTSGAPDDCRTVAAFELSGLEQKIKQVLGNAELKLDTYTRAHLEETAGLIRKVVDARLNLQRP
ncbi:MAG TPA: zinc-dependent metalloprotease [Pirellulales bacterium]|nr:zinc-dependent metalloprotease [Pirellulales bacterium]